MLTPRPTPTRNALSLDGIWDFALDPETHDPEARASTPWTSRLNSRTQVAVPASYNDQLVGDHARDHVGLAWYQRTVQVPLNWDTGRVVLRFDAVTHEGHVYLDDQHVGSHVGGYTPFEIDVTELVEPGQTFRLTVGVDNRLTEETIPPGHIFVRPDGSKKQQYHHDFFNYSGIARSVRLLQIPATSIEDLTVVTTFDGSTGIVDYTVETTSEADVVTVLRDEDGHEVASATGASGRLTVPEAHLWQPGAAYLYELETTLKKDGQLVDLYRLPVGIRTVAVEGQQLLLNGEPFYFTGFGKHEDSAIRGKGHDDSYLVHDFELLRWIGANSFRASHYPYAEEVLDHADRHGIVVIDETAAVGFNLGVAGGMSQRNPKPTFSPETLGDKTQSTHAQHLRELINRDKNHPSVVMWCIANEPAAQEDGAREYFAPLVSLARELDPTRPMTYTAWLMDNAENDQIGDLFDVIGINRYFGWYIDVGDLGAAELKLEADIRGWLDRFDKPVMMMEYGADTLQGMRDLDAAPWSEDYQTAYLDMHHRVFDKFSGFVGEHVWNFADFRTGPGIHRVGGNKKGIFTRDRSPKAAAFALRERWTRIGRTKPRP